MKIQRTIYRGIGSLTFLATLAVASGGIVPAAFAQTTNTSSSTNTTSSTTAPTYCNTTATAQGYYVTTDMANYVQGQNINFCLVNNTRNPMFVSGTHPWEITGPNGTVLFTPNAGMLNSTSTSSSFFTDVWNGMGANNVNVNPGTYTVVFNGFPGSPAAMFTIAASGTSSTSTSSTTGTTGSTGSTTSTSTTQVDWTNLLGQLQTIEAALSSLLQQIQIALNNSGNNGTGTGVVGLATIDQNGQSVMAGSTIDFSGRNFMHEENVTITLNGSVVGTAHADGGGNFSTGNMHTPTTPGSYMYTFTGQKGDSTQATITVH